MKAFYMASMLEHLSAQRGFFRPLIGVIAFLGMN